jgi:hypothetical protein
MSRRPSRICKTIHRRTSHNPQHLAFKSDVMCARRQAKQIRLMAVLASLVLIISSSCAQAADPSGLRDDPEQSQTIDMNAMSSWLRSRFSATELEQLQPGQLRVQAHYCGCSDRPRAHFPYQLVLLQTPKGDLVARPEHHEFGVEFSALAVRYGTRYCAIDETDCYGSFAQPCDFSDFRYGPPVSSAVLSHLQRGRGVRRRDTGG